MINNFNEKYGELYDYNILLNNSDDSNKSVEQQLEDRNNKSRIEKDGK